MAELPELVELQKEWKDEGVRVQTVALDVAMPKGREPRRVDTAEEIRVFLEQRGLELETLAYAGDPRGLQVQWNLQGTPLTVAIDASGEIVDRQVGAVPKNRLEKMIEKALGR